MTGEEKQQVPPLRSYEQKPERVHTGEQIHFPHLAKNERDMGHPPLRLGKSFETCSFLP
jgi:hypothetical protein